jgi:hypothetical protein
MQVPNVRICTTAGTRNAFPIPRCARRGGGEELGYGDLVQSWLTSGGADVCCVVCDGELCMSAGLVC